MFERFTTAARDVVQGAVEKGEKSGAILPEHLVLALLDRTGTKGAAILTHFHVDAQAVAGELAARARRGGFSDADAEALSGLGIDLDTVVAAVEKAHGPGALAHKRGRKRFHSPFTAEAKRVLEQSLREALDRRDRHIGDEHLLLALLALPGPGDALGLSYRDVRAYLAQAS